MIVKLYGVLTDHTKTHQIEIPAVGDTEALMTYLESKFPGIGIFSIRIAVNNILVEGKTSLAAGDTVSLIPPFPGG